MSARSALFCLLVVSAPLAACHPGRPQAGPPARATHLAVADPPSLWRIDVLDRRKTTASLLLCADAAVQKGFLRPNPAALGLPCSVVGAVEKPGVYSARCRSGDALYRVGARADGDLKHDFKVEMDVTRQDAKGPMYEQVRRYRKVGPCPADWTNGDSAALGSTTVVNTLTGERRTSAAASG